jgi:hypothetical protein
MVTAAFPIRQGRVGMARVEVKAGNMVIQAEAIPVAGTDL